MEILALLLAVFVGVLLVVLIQPKKSIVALLLTFSGAYLLSITVLKLFPEIYHNASDSKIGVFVILGLLLQLILDYFSKGAEHGHTHALEFNFFPWALFFSLNIHAFMEGLPLSGHHHHQLLWAIVIHKIPIAMVLASLFIHQGIHKKYAVFFLFVFALMTPLATVLGDSISFLVQYRNEINAVVAGTFLHIATIILFESSKDHRFNIYKFIALISGILLALML